MHLPRNATAAKISDNVKKFVIMDTIFQIIVSAQNKFLTVCSK